MPSKTKYSAITTEVFEITELVTDSGFRLTKPLVCERIIWHECSADERIHSTYVRYGCSVLGIPAERNGYEFVSSLLQAIAYAVESSVKPRPDKTKIKEYFTLPETEAKKD